MTETSTAPASTASTPWLAPLMTGLVILAGLAQLCFLANWPLYVWDIRLPYTLAAVVALVRMSLYLGLGWGLAHREAAAWAGTVMELYRTFFLAAALTVDAFFRHEAHLGSVFPAVWAQGLLSMLLPVALLVDIALASGWRPGPSFDPRFDAGVKTVAALLLGAAMTMGREHAAFGVADRERRGTLWRRGLPFVLTLCVVEGLAVMLTLGARAASSSRLPAPPALHAAHFGRDVSRAISPPLSTR